MVSTVIKFVLKHPWIAAALALMPIAIIIFAIVLMISIMSSIAGNQQCGSSSSSSDDESTTITGKVGGTWTQKGTRAYNLAKQIYIGAKKLGFNDAGAAGVVGNAEAEGAATGQLDEGEHDSSGDGGKGIFQFTPGSAGGGTLESYESWCSKHGYHPWQSAYVEEKGLMAIKGFSKSKNPSSPAKGADNWYFGCEDGVDNGTLHPKREPAAEKAYKMFNGLGGSSDADSTADSSGKSCSNGSDSGDTSSIVKFAESCIDKYPYAPDDGPTRNQIQTEDGKEGANADCSSFAWYVYKKCGYKVSKNAWNTVTAPQYLKQVSSSDAQPGDSAIVNGSDAHYMILIQHYHGPNTLIINCGGCSVQSDIKKGKANNVNISTMADAEPNHNWKFYRPIKN